MVWLTAGFDGKPWILNLAVNQFRNLVVAVTFC